MCPECMYIPVCHCMTLQSCHMCICHYTHVASIRGWGPMCKCMPRCVLYVPVSDALVCVRASAFVPDSYTTQNP